MHTSPGFTARYEVVHATTYYYTEPVALCHNELHLAPRTTARQTCLRHSLEVSPAASEVEESIDYFGNRVNLFRVSEPHVEFSVTARGEVGLAPARVIDAAATPPWTHVVEHLRAAAEPGAFEATQFAYDSPLVTVDDQLAAYARPLFPRDRPWLEAILDLTKRIHRDFVYDATATNISTPLATVMELRRGVCQDFAHLQIGCLRAMGLAARYVSGYLLTSPPPGQPRLIGADASHAWLSAWCPGLGWVDFDPTNDVVPDLEHITVAWGRDYDDVCPIKGVFVGGGEHSMRVSVDVQKIENGKAEK
jgi:transglutaminase-like putative cysteine protease